MRGGHSADDGICQETVGRGMKAEKIKERLYYP